jgi:energy-coupling factor transport system permease protein
MASYDALRHVTIGQYIPTGSVLHRLDPRAKLLSLGLLVIAVVIATSYISSALLLVLVLALVWLSRLPLRYVLSSILPALPVILILALLQLLFYGNAYVTPGVDSRVLLAWGPIRISTLSVRMVLVLLTRFLDLLCLASLLTNTTTTSALTHGMESLLRPFSALGLPGHEIALIGAIALRFVPILGEELEAIMQAQASRGVGVESGSRWQFMRNVRRLATLIVPLFVDIYRRSEEMVLAMQARCYQGGKGRTHLIALQFAPKDYLALVLTALSAVIVVVVLRLPLP